jgi:hypothetical protein
MTKPSSFYGYTNPDGTRMHDAPENWVWGTVGPVSPYAFRYAPDSAVDEKQPRINAKPSKRIVVEPTFLPSCSPGSFDALTKHLTSLGDKK